jgi:ATP-binding cassette subfamily F protein 3
MNGTPRPPNVLILDEPTNHLDLESREALEDALRSFEGAILLVSHDRALLDAVGTRTVAIEDGSLRSYEGGWPEYVRVREERLASGVGAGRNGGPNKNLVSSGRAGVGAQETTDADSLDSTNDSTANKPAVKQAKAVRGTKSNGPSKNRLREQDKAELAVEEAETALKALEDELADPAAWATKYEAAKSQARHTAAKRAVEAAYEHLGALVD